MSTKGWALYWKVEKHLINVTGNYHHWCYHSSSRAFAQIGVYLKLCSFTVNDLLQFCREFSFPSAKTPLQMTFPLVLGAVRSALNNLAPMWVSPNINLTTGSVAFSHSSWTQSEVRTEIEVTIINRLHKLHNQHSQFTPYKCIRHFIIFLCFGACITIWILRG